MLLAITVWLVPSRTTPQTDFWQKTTAPLKPVRAVTFNPTGDIFAGSSTGTPGQTGIMRSTDNGSTWSIPLNVNIPNVMALAVEPQGDIFVGAWGLGVFHSTDNGTTWTAVNNGLTDTLVVVLAVTPDSGHIFVGTYGGPYTFRGGIFRSKDKGNSWSRLKLRPVRDNYIWSLAVSPRGYIYVGGQKGVFRSMNDGKTWRRVRPSKLKSNAIWHLTIDANRSIYAASSFGIFRSTDQGKTWTKLSQLGHILSITVSSNGYIFVGVKEGVLQSTDNGNTWSQINSGLEGEVYSLVINSDGYLFAATTEGLYRSVQSLPTSQSLFQGGTITDEPPISFALHQNYPNPFNPTTTIEFELTEDALVTAKVYNTLGQEVASLAEREEFGEGTNELEFNASSLPSGVYYYRIVAEDVDGKGVVYSNVRKMILVK